MKKFWHISVSVEGSLKECLMATYARVVMAVSGVTLVVCCLSLTCDGAELWVVWTWEILYSLVGVDAVGKRGVDGTTKLGWSVEALLRRRWFVLCVALTVHEQRTEVMAGRQPHHWSQ